MVLYKYLPLREKADHDWNNIIDLLKGPSLRFSHLNSLNDPFEAISIYKKKNVEQLSKHLIEIDKAVYCLTKHHNNILMWSHYCSGHSGVVVGFDTKKCDVLRKARKVKYIKNLKLRKKAILSKSIAWSYEKEYRVVKPKNYFKSDYYGESIPYNDEAITIIYLGKNIDFLKANMIFKVCEQLKAKCYIFSHITPGFKMKFKKITSSDDLKFLLKKDALVRISKKNS